MYDEDIERAVLDYIIFQKEDLNVNEEDFVFEKHKEILRAINILKDKKEEVTPLSIKNTIKKENTDILIYISTIAQSWYGTTIDYAYKELKNLSKKRKIMKLSDEIKEKVSNEEEIEIFIEKLIKRLNEINSEGNKEKTFLEMVAETSNVIEQKMIQGSSYDYKYYTGIFDLDKATNGLHEEELTIIGARPRSRKDNTSIANSCTYSRKRNDSRNNKFRNV